MVIERDILGSGSDHRRWDLGTPPEDVHMTYCLISEPLFNK